MKYLLKQLMTLCCSKEIIFIMIRTICYLLLFEEEYLQECLHTFILSICGAMPTTFIPLLTRDSTRFLPIPVLATVIKAILSVQRCSILGYFICVIRRERSVELKLQNLSEFRSTGVFFYIGVKLWPKITKGRANLQTDKDASTMVTVYKLFLY